ncbi:MAG TPA: hypothetical protein VFA84_02440 [Acidimicrobiales bacterium]|nr:hypothetical protein [Acidimicrobiales bacterium]
MPDVPTEQPDDKDLQDHTFGMNAARRAEEAEARAAKGDIPRGADDDERPPEPHAGGKA